MWIAAIAGAVLSPILLIMDLGRPHLFLNMLRVFKHRSAMSMGAWILTTFGTSAVAGLITLELHAHQIFPGTLDQLLRLAAGIFIFGAAIFGTLLATYTGVLIGATAIPAWFLHRTFLPIHFGTAGLGSAAGVLELLGHRIAALNFLGFYAAAVETTLLIWLSLDKKGAANRAVHEHGSGWLIRIGEVLNGPLALVLRFLGFIPWAAIAFLAGALVSRIGWMRSAKFPGPIRKQSSPRNAASDEAKIARLSFLAAFSSEEGPAILSFVAPANPADAQWRHIGRGREALNVKQPPSRKAI
jgi:hypothetical protein